MRGLAIGIFVVVTLASADGRAFCGFYVKQDDERVTSRASRVVLLRDGTTTVLSMQNSYEGPPEDFALIVPVPTSIGEDDVRTLEPEVFDRIDQLTSPRLVEYWEAAPHCPTPGEGVGMIGYGSGAGGMGGHVHVEAAFAVGEYDVVILGASESSALEAWLQQEGYRVPPGAAEALRPYVQQGYRFFAARVNASRVRFEDGRALLSPLRIRYDSPQLALPVRLGMLSSPGEQDLLVWVVSRDGRYEVANRENVMVPTNLEVSASLRGRFGAFYDALLDRVWEHHRGAVITEYAWEATSCDPCPGPTMSAEDITTLGGDVASGAQRQSSPVGLHLGPVLPRAGARIGTAELTRSVHQAQVVECVERPGSWTADVVVRDGAIVSAEVEPASATASCIARALASGPSPPARPSSALTRARFQIGVNRTVSYAQRSAHGFTVTRMRYRYGAGSPASDLVFRRAHPIDGGTGEPDTEGRLRVTPRRAAANTFQARYAVLHRYTGAVRCRSPIHMGWGGAPRGRRGARARTASFLDDTRGPALNLRAVVRTPVPSIGLYARRRRARHGALWLLAPVAVGAVVLARRRRR